MYPNGRANPDSRWPIKPMIFTKLSENSKLKTFRGNIFPFLNFMQSLLR